MARKPFCFGGKVYFGRQGVCYEAGIKHVQQHKIQCTETSQIITNKASTAGSRQPLGSAQQIVDQNTVFQSIHSEANKLSLIQDHATAEPVHNPLGASSAKTL